MFYDPMFYVTVICTLALVAVAQRLALVVVRKLDQVRAQLAVYDTEAIRRHQAAAESAQQRHEGMLERLDALDRAKRFGVVLVVGAYRVRDSEQPGGTRLVQFIAGRRVALDQKFGAEPLSGEAEIGPVHYPLEPGTLLIAIGPCVLEAIAVGTEIAGPWSHNNETPIAVISNPIHVGTQIRARVRALPW